MSRYFTDSPEIEDTFLIVFNRSERINENLKQSVDHFICLGLRSVNSRMMMRQNSAIRYSQPRIPANTHKSETSPSSPSVDKSAFWRHSIFTITFDLFLAPSSTLHLPHDLLLLPAPPSFSPFVYIRPTSLSPRLQRSPLHELHTHRQVVLRRFLGLHCCVYFIMDGFIDPIPDNSVHFHPEYSTLRANIDPRSPNNWLSDLWRI